MYNEIIKMKREIEILDKKIDSIVMNLRLLLVVIAIIIVMKVVI